MNIRILFIVFIIGYCVNAQSFSNQDVILNINYSPSINSDASFFNSGVELKILNFKLNKGELELRANYNYKNINYENDNGYFNDLRNFHKIGADILYSYPLNEKWKVHAKVNPFTHSNFTVELKPSDFYVNGLLAFQHQKNENTKFNFGVAYNNILGFPAPTPYIDYWKQFNEKWSFNLGFPVTKVNRSLNKQSQVSFETIWDGFNANINRNRNDVVLFQQNRIAEKIGARELYSGFEYSYTNNKFSAKVNAGVNYLRDFELQNDNNVTAYSFNMGESLKVGLELNYNF